MTIKHTVRVTAAAALASLAVWGATGVGAAPFEHRHKAAGRSIGS